MSIESYNSLPECVEKLELKKMGISFDETDLKLVFLWINSLPNEKLEVGKHYHPHLLDREVDYLGKGHFSVKLEEQSGKVPIIFYNKNNGTAQLEF